LKKGTKPNADVAGPFEAFWALYPRKTEGRSACRKAWDSALKRASPLEITEGVRRYPFKPDFLPMASTWLNQSRWLTEPDTPPPTVERQMNGQREPVFRNGALEALREMAEEGLIIEGTHEPDMFAGLLGHD